MIIMIVVLAGMMWFMNRSRKKALQQQEEREKEMAANLAPGVWVHTAVGFWGQFVDMDGDIMVLATTDGTETLWDRRMIREVGEQPPFADQLTIDETEEEVEEDAPVLGLDSDASETDTASTDEETK
ncbi:preprotein translocase subunit YajC [Schaalia sp. ZJ405]|uniref:preprotein translocase subunit YajC n=1 Tax=unclassified Schaalia TaxID=2691889 RepID=UPI0013ED067D|nr:MULTISPECIES: preprotein translocase subunit YajC [unclassified Schaalia]QPK80521.1 preprotein translocase subunit YajC [Schaalia sp. ZJ405]